MQWEYMRTPIRLEFGHHQQLNELGAEGWELVTVLGNGGAPVAWLKRPKQSAAFVDIGEPA